MKDAFMQLKAGSNKTHIILKIPSIFILRRNLKAAISSVNKCNPLQKTKKGACRLYIYFADIPSIDPCKQNEMSFFHEVIRLAYDQAYGNYEQSVATISGGVLHSKPGIGRQGFHMDDKNTESHTMFFGVSRHSSVHIADYWDTNNEILVGKQEIKYGAGDLLILRPNLPHAGAEWKPTTVTDSNRINTRLFYSVNQAPSINSDQQWFYEKGNKYEGHGIPGGGFGAFPKKIQNRNFPFSLANDSCTDEDELYDV
jgi:hypothetical protein